MMQINFGRFLKKQKNSIKNFGSSPKKGELLDGIYSIKNEKLIPSP